MSDTAFRMRRGWRGITRRLRELQMIAGGAVSTRHPIMAHIIPIRRCNLSCTYCNEYDDFSKPVPKDTMVARLNKLADLGTRIITFSGGEPLVRQDLEELIAEFTLYSQLGVGIVLLGIVMFAPRGLAGLFPRRSPQRVT
mgnify:CR=1 FL=1